MGCSKRCDHKYNTLPLPNSLLTSTNGQARPSRQTSPICNTAGLPTKQFRKWRDESGVYDHLQPRERPSFHDIRALGIMPYFKAGYPKEYIMALAVHANEDMTNHYIDGHE
tara:strand:+ start:8621 stop:8953 length:333 start_codon:yes stop_codon:yes gene_type:complete